MRRATERSCHARVSLITGDQGGAVAQRDDPGASGGLSANSDVEESDHVLLFEQRGEIADIAFCQQTTLHVHDGLPEEAHASRQQGPAKAVPNTAVHQRS